MKDVQPVPAQSVKVFIDPLDPKFVPVYATAGSAGCDLIAYEDTYITPGETVAVPIGIKVIIPDGFEWQIRPRSSLAKKGITMPNSPGTIDSDYRGEVKVLLTNTSFENNVLIKEGDRIAQAVLAPVYVCDFYLSTITPDTERGSGGFGSTGV